MDFDILHQHSFTRACEWTIFSMVWRERGTRQGDPLSPYFFLICAKLLASMIGQNENIHGINILDEDILLVDENHFAHVCVSYSSLLQCLV